MARIAALTNLSPLLYSTLSPVTSEDVRAALEMSHWAGAKRTSVQLWSFGGGNQGWGAANDPASIILRFHTAGGLFEVCRFTVFIDPDAVSVKVGALTQMATSNAGDVKYIVGSTDVTIARSDADNGTESTAILETNKTGVGEQTVIIQLELTSGISTQNYILFSRGETVALDTADLPDPEGRLLSRDYVITSATDPVVDSSGNRVYR